MTAAEAIDAVDQRDPEMLADVLIDLSEKDRRALYPALMERTGATPTPDRKQPELDCCFFISLWGTGTSRDVRNATSSWRFVPDPRLADVVAVRPRKTIDALVKASLRDDWNRGSWFVVRDLIRRQVISHPDSESYYVALVQALPIVVGPRRREQGPEPLADAIVGRLREDAALPDELLRAFDFEEGVNWITGPYIADAWLLAFRRAVESGIFDREVVFDICLDGQLRDLRKSATSFFRKLFDSLDPTLDDKARRVDKFIRIISSSAPSEQAAAAKVVSDIARGGHEFDSGPIASAVVTPLTGSQKGAAIAALRLLSETSLPLGERAQAATHGLGHPHADVQEASLRLIEQCGDEIPVGVRADALMWVDAVAPALRDRVARLVGVDVPTPSDDAQNTDFGERLAAFSEPNFPGANLEQLVAAVGRGEMPGVLTFDQWSLPDAGAVLEPIHDVDELVTTLTVVLAGAGTPLDLERVIDGLSRFDPAKISDAALSPVRASFRGEYQGAGWHGWEVRGHVEVAARYWCARTTPPRLPYLAANQRLLRRSPALSHDLTQPPKDAEGQWWSAAFDGSSYSAGVMGFLAARLWEAVTAGTTNPLPTLAFPTTTSGWLDDAALLARLAHHKKLRVSPGRFDAVQALLRLRPGHDHANAAAGEADDYRTPVSVALARFRGASADPSDPGLVRAVNEKGQARSIRLVSFPRRNQEAELTVLRYGLEKAAPLQRRDDPIGQILAELEPPIDRPVVNARWTPAASTIFSSDQLLVDWTVIGLPRHRDIVAARAAAMLAEDLDANRSSDCLHTLLSAATVPDLPLTFGMHVLLGMGLADRNIVTGAAASDLLHDAAIDGRLDASLLGRILAELSNGGIIKPSRFAKAASAVVPMSPLVAERVRQTLSVWLGGVEGVPRDLHAILETLELACARSGTGVDLDTAVDKLTEAANGSSKRAKSARRILSLPIGSPSAAISAAGHALLDRAERWAASAH